MRHSQKWSRRKFIRYTSRSVMALLLGGATVNLLSSCSKGGKEKGRLPQSILEPDVEVDLSAVQAEQHIFDGPKTKVWRYEGSVIRGDAGILQEIPGSYLGPIFRVKQGQQIRVNFTNQVLEPTIVHWHGLHLSEEMDGHPIYAIQPGKNYQYDFQVSDRAGTYWFHPHPDQLTGPQVYRGLAGLFIVSDEEESKTGLPAGEFDVPLVIQDRTIDNNNQFLYLSGGNTERMMGVLGETILVNGRPDFVLSASTMTYRLRLLNGSNSRIYKLAWEDGTPLTVIGTDGGLLESAVQRPYIVLGPAERVELWVDFHGKTVGSQMRVVSLAFSAGVSGMMGMMGSRSPLQNGDPFPVLTVSIVREEVSRQKASPPRKLSMVQRYQEQDATNQRQPRTFTLGMGGMGMGGMGMDWTVNGRTFEMKGVARDEIVKLNTLELWRYDNQGGGGMMGGGMMQMPHPMHIHGLQFQVLGWDVDPAFQTIWDSVREGFVTEGWKDTVVGHARYSREAFVEVPGL